MRTLLRSRWLLLSLAVSTVPVAGLFTLSRMFYVRDLSMTGTAAPGTPPAACNGAAGLASGYHAWADPASSSTGTRYFFTNTTGTIWQATASIGSGGSDSASPSGGTAIQ